MKNKREGLPQGARFNVFRRDGFRCRYCGRASPDVVLHADHIVAVANGGADSEDNLITSCADCNYGKGTKDVYVERPAPELGLVGYYGHQFIGGKIQYQFQIVRKINDDLYMIQFYEFFFGCPTNTESRTLEFLLGPTCRIYSEHALWKHAMDTAIERDAGKPQREIVFS